MVQQNTELELDATNRKIVEKLRVENATDNVALERIGKRNAAISNIKFTPETLQSSQIKLDTLVVGNRVDLTGLEERIQERNLKAEAKRRVNERTK